MGMDDSVEMIDLFSGAATSRDSNGYQIGNLGPLAMLLPRSSQGWDDVPETSQPRHHPYPLPHPNVYALLGSGADIQRLSRVHHPWDERMRPFQGCRWNVSYRLAVSVHLARFCFRRRGILLRSPWCRRGNLVPNIFLINGVPQI